MALKLTTFLTAAVLVGGLAVAPAAHAQSSTPPPAPGASTDHGATGDDGTAPAKPPSHQQGMMGNGMMGGTPNGQGQNQGMMGGGGMMGNGMMGGAPNGQGQNQGMMGGGMMGDRGGMGGMQGMMQMMTVMMQMNMMNSMSEMMNTMSRMAADCDHAMAHMNAAPAMSAKPPG